MALCSACGHLLGVGRFCTNCGHRVDGVSRQPEPPSDEWRTDTAERSPRPDAVVPDLPPPTPKVPPAAVTPPPPPRYPLFADELPGTSVGNAEPEADTPQRSEPAPMIEQPEPAEPWEPDGDERRSVLTWVAAALLVALLLVGGWLVWDYLQADPGESAGEKPSTESPSGSADPGTVDVAAQATAVAPETAPPSEDVNGELVSFDASNMLDGVPETAWRTPGDASGMELTFRLGQRTTLTSVGMVNGYDKRAKDGQGRTFDWYRGHRRVLAVVWDFGEGTTVRQKLVDDRSLQTIEIEPVSTRKVLVRLVKVSPPGEGRASRDYTAISEVSLVGTAGS